MIDDVGEAFARAMTISTRNDTVLVTGSLYTIGEGRRWWDSHKTR
jgi:folylpolyglutamate synthase/dihydropteroate synthase